MRPDCKEMAPEYKEKPLYINIYIYTVTLIINQQNLLVLSREWMGMGVAVIIMDSSPVDHSLIPYV